MTNKYAGDDDILQEIGPENITRLLDVLKKDWPQTVSISHAVKTFNDWKTKDPTLDAHILCPNGSWKEGTVLCDAMIGSLRISLYSCEEKCTTLRRCLEETKRIPWSAEYITFLSTDEKFCDTVLQVLHSKVDRNIVEKANTTYWVTDEPVSRLQPKCPPDVYVAPLQVSHAVKINNSWPHRSAISLQFIQHILQTGSDNFGVFTAQDSQLVAWVLDVDYGVGMLGTDVDHRNKGYAKLVLKNMFQSLIKHGKHISLHIVEGNVPSTKLLKSIGAIRLSKCKFIAVIP